MDAECNNVGGRALTSIGPEQLILPPFTSLEADRNFYDEFARPFVSQFSNTPGPAGDVATNATEATSLAATPAHTALALTLLLDQLSRNLFRGAAQVQVYTHYDRLALALCAQIRRLQLDLSFVDTPIWRLWLYMPLIHSEAVADHETVRALLQEMLAGARNSSDLASEKFVEAIVGGEERHWTPLLSFGRYPWRNQWIGRESTEAETMWLDNGGDRFGTG